MPSRDEILAFVADNPGAAGKREIARHFGITGGARVFLKKLLREMADEGLLEKRQKKLVRAGDLPPVLVALVTARDGDGELIAVPASWDEEEQGTAPSILVIDGAGDRAFGFPASETGCSCA